MRARLEELLVARRRIDFRLSSRRCQRGSILITTNKGIEHWPEILAGDQVPATQARSVPP